ncbi:hypothetical protein BG004_000797 [Podila humilis]|nr:hypothetical protein BG004_000797 [Podila humilis]
MHSSPNHSGKVDVDRDHVAREQDQEKKQTMDQAMDQAMDQDVGKTMDQNLDKTMDNNQSKNIGIDHGNDNDNDNDIDIDIDNDSDNDKENTIEKKQSSSLAGSPHTNESRGGSSENTRDHTEDRQEWSSEEDDGGDRAEGVSGNDNPEKSTSKHTTESRAWAKRRTRSSRMLNDLSSKVKGHRNDNDNDNDNDNGDGDDDDDDNTSNNNNTNDNDDDNDDDSNNSDNDDDHSRMSVDTEGHSYTLEQQRLKDTVAAATTVSRVLRESIHDPDSFHSGSVDADDYELIQQTFGDIEDWNLNLNLTGHMSATDDSSGEDDHLTKDLKRQHRQAKSILTDTTSAFVKARRSLIHKKNADLDLEEKQIKAGTHPSLIAELHAIEDRRKSKLSVVAARKSYHQDSINNNFTAACKAAHDQYNDGQITARKTLLDLVQNRINRIKEEIIRDSQSRSMNAHRALTASLKRRETLWDDDGNDSCGDSCSSYDSYSSSGSECSDCEICMLQYDPRLRARRPPSYPRGLSHGEAEADIAYLYRDRDSQSSVRRSGVRKQPDRAAIRSHALLVVADREHKDLTLKQSRIAMIRRNKESAGGERGGREQEGERRGNRRGEHDVDERASREVARGERDFERARGVRIDEERGERKPDTTLDRYYDNEWRQVMEDRTRPLQHPLAAEHPRSESRKRRVEETSPGVEAQNKAAHVTKHSSPAMHHSKPTQPSAPSSVVSKPSALTKNSSSTSFPSSSIRNYSNGMDIDSDMSGRPSSLSSSYEEQMMLQRQRESLWPHEARAKPMYTKPLPAGNNREPYHRQPRFVPGFGPEGLEARLKANREDGQMSSAPSSRNSLPKSTAATTAEAAMFSSRQLSRPEPLLLLPPAPVSSSSTRSTLGSSSRPKPPTLPPGQQQRRSTAMTTAMSTAASTSSSSSTSQSQSQSLSSTSQSSTLSPPTHRKPTLGRPRTVDVLARGSSLVSKESA